MSLKAKLLAVFLALAVAFGGGAWVGFHMDRGDVDPQDHITTVFTPYEDGSDAYIAFLAKAKKSVHMAVYAYTDPRITDTLVELKRNNPKIEIRLLFDYSQTQGWSGKTIMAQTERLRAAGIEVTFGTSEKSKDLMHSKFTVVDGEWVEDGSWNYTRAADSQANVQNYVRSKKRAALFLANWERMHRFMKSQNLEPKLPDDDKSKPATPAPAGKPTKKRSR